MSSDMPFNEAIRVLLTAADVRQQQWERLADGAPISDIVEELHEVAGRMEEDPDDTEAANLGGMIWVAILTVQNSTVIDFVEHAETLLCEMIQDAQKRCEEASGADIVVPEDAAPELDDARGHIREAIDILRKLAEDQVEAADRAQRSSELCGND